jgi:hypothetical protein
MQGPIDGLLDYLPEGRRVVVGLSRPNLGQVTTPGGLLWITSSAPRRGRRPRDLREGLSVVTARPAALPVANGAAEGLLCVGPLASELKDLADLAPLSAAVRDGGRLVLAEPAPRGPVRKLLLRATEGEAAPHPEQLTALAMLAGLADVRQEEIERPPWGRWIVTWGRVRKL